MSATREWSLVLGGLDRKPSATLAGSTLECTYDPATKEAVVKLPRQDASVAMKVVVKY